MCQCVERSRGIMDGDCDVQFHSITTFLPSNSFFTWNVNLSSKVVIYTTKGRSNSVLMEESGIASTFRYYLKVVKCDVLRAAS